MTIDELRWMEALFKTGKMSKAAEQLYVSQPALSQCLQRIEQQLGFSLFERSNKGVFPTEKGRLFYEMAKQVRSSYDDFLAKAALLDQAALQSVTIGMAPYLSSKASTDLLLRLSHAFPQYHFSVCDSWADDLMDQLLKNKIQIMITSDTIAPQGIITHVLTEARNMVYLRAGSPLAVYGYKENGRQYLDPVYLKEEPITLTRKGQASRDLAENLFAECGYKPNLFHETSHISTLFKNAKAGLSSSVGSCTQESYTMDEDHSVIYYVPDTYKCAKFKIVTYTLAETDKLIPREMFAIIREIIQKCGVYFIEG